MAAIIDFDRRAVFLRDIRYASDTLSAHSGIRVKYRHENGTLSGDSLDNGHSCFGMAAICLTNLTTAHRRIIAQGRKPLPFVARRRDVLSRTAITTDVRPLVMPLRPVEDGPSEYSWATAISLFWMTQIGQTLEHADDTGPVQRQHVVSLDGIIRRDRSGP